MSNAIPEDFIRKTVDVLYGCAKQMPAGAMRDALVLRAITYMDLVETHRMHKVKHPNVEQEANGFVIQGLPFTTEVKIIYALVKRLGGDARIAISELPMNEDTQGVAIDQQDEYINVVVDKL